MSCSSGNLYTIEHRRHGLAQTLPADRTHAWGLKVHSPMGAGCKQVHFTAGEPGINQLAHSINENLSFRLFEKLVLF